MPRKGKISVIWFRDDEPARRLRLSPGWFRAATYLALILALLAGGGAWAGWEFWQRALDLREDKREVEKRLAETLHKLERLQNIDKLLRTSDATELTQLLAGLGVEMPAAKATPQPAPSPKDAKEAAKAAKNAPPEREKSAFDLAEVMSRVDAGQVGVENFRGKIDAKTVQYGFDLSNLNTQASLSGAGQLLVVCRDGSMTPLETGKDDLTFQIQRFKQVSAQAPLPAQVDKPGQVFGLRLVVTAAGKTIFSETYPLAQAQ